MIYKTSLILIYFYIILLLFPLAIFSQGHSSNWVFGYGEFESTSDYGGNILDFHQLYVDTNRVVHTMNMFETNASMSDTNGNLLFYTNGLYISNANHVLMQNGDSLNPAPYTFNRYPYGLRVPQGALILPAPGNQNLYYLFHETLHFFPNIYWNYFPLELSYSVIDITQNSGLGAVVSKNQTLLADTLNPGAITSCKHGNGRDWWIFVHKYNEDKYYKFLFTPYSIFGPMIQSVGSQLIDNWIWQSCFSPDGTKYASITGKNLLDIFNFDRCSGNLTLLETVQITDSAYARGLAFAPGSRYLYVSSSCFLYQFDTDTSNISASKALVGIYDGFADPTIPLRTIFYLAQLGSDGKIYITNTNGSRWLNVINQPDSGGLSCDFTQHSLLLSTPNAFSIPNFPNYNLDKLIGSVCDSL